jgi:hypothetical protein
VWKGYLEGSSKKPVAARERNERCGDAREGRAESRARPGVNRS